MNFNSLHAIPGPLVQPVLQIPTVQSEEGVWNYTLNSYQNQTDLTTYFPPKYQGIGNLTLVANWEGAVVDNAQVHLHIRQWRDTNFAAPTVLDTIDVFTIHVAKTFPIVYPYWDVIVEPFLPTGPTGGTPSSNLLKLNLVIQRPNGLYEVL